MDRLQQLLNDLASIDSKIDTLLAGDTLTDDQKAEHDRLVADRAKTTAAIQREKEKLAREDERETLAAEVTATATRRAGRGQRAVLLGGGDGANLATLPSPGIIPAGPMSGHQLPNTADIPGGGRLRIPATVKRHGNLKHFVGIRNGVAADERAYRFGTWGLAMLAIQMPGRYGYHPKFREAIGIFEREWMPGIGAAAHGSADSTGAQFLIPEEFSTDMIDLRERYGVARRLLRRETMMSDTKTIPRRSGGLTAYFTPENSAGTESNKSWTQVRLTAKDLMAISRYSAQVDADAAISFGDDLAGEISYAFANKEDECGFNGDGTSTYGGIVGVRTKLTSVDGAGTDSAGLVTQGTSNTWTAIVIGDFDRVVGKLPQYADTPSACWVMHRTFYYEVCERLVQASGGVPAYEVREGNRAPRPLFKGYPVEFAQTFPAVTAVATVVAVLGDLSLGAAFGDRQQESIVFSEHATVGGESLWERNQIGIRGTERFDINVHDAGDASTVGPIVGLRTGN